MQHSLMKKIVNYRKQLNEIYGLMKEMKAEMSDLKLQLDFNKLELTKVKSENARLKQALNQQYYQYDALEQYGRRENIRIHGITVKRDNKDDGEEVLKEIANTLNIELDDCAIQRAHRLGKKRINQSKPRPIIARFLSYKKRNEFLFSKSNLKDKPLYKDAFITEDLTPLRSKLLRYIKAECDDAFVLVHSMNGKIRMKKSARKAGKIIDGEDEGIGSWLYVNSPDDLFKHDIDIDFEKLGHTPLNFNLVFDEYDTDSDA